MGLNDPAPPHKPFSHLPWGLGLGGGGGLVPTQKPHPDQRLSSVQGSVLPRRAHPPMEC